MKQKTEPRFEAKKQQGKLAETELCEIISKKPGLSTYELQKKTKWSGGKVRAAINRLEKIGIIETEKIMEDGRIKRICKPTNWKKLVKNNGLIKKKEIDEISKVSNTKNRIKINISWNAYGNLLKVLESKTERLSKFIDNVYGLPRGGLPVAVHFSNYFNKPLITDPSKITSRTLITEDVIDSGNSIISLIGEKNAKKYLIICLCWRKTSKVKPTEYALDAQDNWLVFPYERWEKKMQTHERSSGVPKHSFVTKIKYILKNKQLFSEDVVKNISK